MKIKAKNQQPKLEYRDLGESRYEVQYAGAVIGHLLAGQEVNGRHCFYLECDTREHPRMYRGREMASRAMLQVFQLAKLAREEKKSLELVIIEAYDNRPAASDTSIVTV